MSKSSKTLATYLPKESAAADRIFGPAPLLPSENPAMYADMLNRMRAAVNPRDIIEEIWVREVVAHSWEILRWRRIKVELHAKLEGWQNDSFPNAEFRQVASNFERVDRLITMAEHRRNATLREVTHYRANFTEQLRGIIDQVTESGDSELSQVTAGSGSSGKLIEDATDRCSGSRRTLRKRELV